MEIDFEQRKKDLQELVNKPWEEKVGLTISKLMEFYVRTDGNCYLSCSGGADSVVLLDICRKVEQLNKGWKFKIVFDDTGLEEPTVREKALSIEDVCVVRPEISFLQVLTQYGYPIISKEVSECVVQARRCLNNQIERDIYIGSKNCLELQNKKMVQKVYTIKINTNVCLMLHLELAMNVAIL